MDPENNKKTGRFLSAPRIAAAAGLLAAWLAAQPAAAQVPAVDPYRVTSAVAGLNLLSVTGLPGAAPPSATVYLFNIRTWDFSQPVTPAADGSFTATVAGQRSDRLSVFVEDALGNTSPATLIYAGALTIKNPYQNSSLWRVGQTHTHTTNSDGENPPAHVEAAYKIAGYDFVVSTDHRGWPTPLYTAADDGMTPDPFNGGVMDLKWIPGAEIGNYQVHLGSWGTSANVSLNNIYYTQQAIDATRALGGIAVIHHPENVDAPYSWEWHEEILPARDVSLIEAFNGKHANEGTVENHIADAIDLADEFQQVWWIGADDCHDINDPLQFNRYATVVQADSTSPSTADILAAADAGRVYIRQTAQGPEISRVSVAGNIVQLTLPDIASDYQVNWYRRGGEIAKQDNGVNVQASYTVQGSEGYVRAEVTRVVDGLKAWTQPLFVANAQDLSVSASNAALVDNSSATAWDAGAATGSFVVDAGSVRNLNAIRIDWDGSGGRRFNYQVEVSDTGLFTGEQLQVVRRTYSNRLPLTLDFFDARSRYVRVVITGQSAGAAANARVREVELFDSTPARSNLYIDNVNGDDANSGRAGSPWKTFNYARDRVRPRDTLNFVQNAVPYAAPLQLYAKNSGKSESATVQFRGANGIPAVVDATGSTYGVTITDARWVEWTDFDIKLATAANLYVNGGANNVVQRNRLRNSQGRGVLGAGNFTLAYNLIYGNASDGIFLYTDGADAKIYNNVVYGNGADGLALQNFGVINATVHNNILAANGRYAFTRESNGVVTDSHNCIQGSLYGFWSQSSTIIADPKFVNPAAGDFSLQLASPCIDAGLDLNYSADFAGEPIRDVLSKPDTGSPGAFRRTYVDIGALEACDTCTTGGSCHQ